MTVPQDHKRSIKKNAVTKTVYICNDPDISEELEDVQDRLSWLSLRVANGVATEEQRADYDKLRERETELKIKVKDTSIIFKFRSIGRKPYDELIDANPPTDSDRAEVEKAGGDPKMLQYSPEAFAIALCQAALVEPQDFDFKEAWNSDDWNQAELAALFSGAMEANTQRRLVPLGNA